jgi:hypothetical protein
VNARCFTFFLSFVQAATLASVFALSVLTE